MGILSWIVVGGLAGLLAGMIMGEKHGLIGKIIIGIIGANIGGFAASLLGMGGINGFNLYSLLIAVAGACLFIWITGRARRR